MTATEKLVNRLKRGEVLRTWDVHHTALSSALAKGLVIVTDDCRLKLFPRVHYLREELNNPNLDAAQRGTLI